MPTIVTRNPGEISLANFTVMSGANHLQRTAGSAALGGVVENGFLKFGHTHQTNITNNTLTGKYYISVSEDYLPGIPGNVGSVALIRVLSITILKTSKAPRLKVV